MATRGRRPSATVVALAQGKIDKPPKGEPIPNGPCYKLDGMTAQQNQMWDEHIAPLFWLTSADAYKAYMWCSLAVRFKKKHSVISSALIGQLRALGSELGMDPASRRRLGNAEGESEKNSPEAQYFDSHPEGSRTRSRH